MRRACDVLWCFCGSIVGEVFDVSKGEKHYGKRGAYRGFTGRDASRAFVTGDFTEVQSCTDSDIRSASRHAMETMTTRALLYVVGLHRIPDVVPSSRLFFGTGKDMRQQMMRPFKWKHVPLSWHIFKLDMQYRDIQIIVFRSVPQHRCLCSCLLGITLWIA